MSCYNHENNSNTKNKQLGQDIVHAPFRKVVKFDLICMGLGIVMGMGIGAFLVSGGA